MDYDKTMLPVFVGLFAAGFLVGVRYTKERVARALKKPIEVGYLQGELLDFVLNELHDDELSVEEFERKVNERLAFIRAVANY